jgi:hypothetical protein
VDGPADLDKSRKVINRRNRDWRYSMKTVKSLFMMISLVLLLLANIGGSVGFTISNVRQGENQDAVKPGEFIVEPPTLLCLGF